MTSDTSSAIGAPWTRCNQCGEPEHGSIPCNLARPARAAPNEELVRALEQEWMVCRKHWKSQAGAVTVLVQYDCLVAKLMAALAAHGAPTSGQEPSEKDCAYD